jgi:hypothetical protein
MEDVIATLNIVFTVDYSNGFGPGSNEVCDGCRFVRSEVQAGQGWYRLFLLIDIEA